MIQPLKNANGFTLLELILSMVIVGFIVAISLGAVRMGISTQEVGQKKTETYQRLRIIGEHLSQKIKSSYPVFVSPPKKLSLPSEISISPTASTDQTNALGQTKRLLAFEGKKNSIRLVTFASPIASTDDSVWAHEVQFYLGEHPDTGKKGIIMMEKEISPGNIFTETDSSSDNESYYLLAEDVAFLKFRYYILEKISQAEAGFGEAGDYKEASPYKGKWVEQVLFDPPIESEPEFTADDGKALQKGTLITLPKGVEISLGLLEPAVAGSNKKPKLVSSPPALLLLHSGMEFNLPPPENDEIQENNAAS